MLPKYVKLRSVAFRGDQVTIYCLHPCPPLCSAGAHSLEMRAEVGEGKKSRRGHESTSRAE
jgi:hypothetical protein